MVSGTVTHKDHALIFFQFRHLRVQGINQEGIILKTAQQRFAHAQIAEKRTVFFNLADNLFVFVPVNHMQ
ncbi:Uncharacterised protein [Klebsiella pneumoniae]|nr:Uncharacterised protein [Klebsiella pneumoniae]